MPHPPGGQFGRAVTAAGGLPVRAEQGGARGWSAEACVIWNRSSLLLQDPRRKKALQDVDGYDAVEHPPGHVPAGASRQSERLLKCLDVVSKWPSIRLWPIGLGSRNFSSESVRTHFIATQRPYRLRQGRRCYPTECELVAPLRAKCLRPARGTPQACSGTGLSNRPRWSWPSTSFEAHGAS